MRRQVTGAGLLLLAVWSSVPGCYEDGLVGGECREGYTDCDGLCVDLTTDGDNCGACGVQCPAGRACYRGIYCEGFGPGAAGAAGADAR